MTRGPAAAAWALATICLLSPTASADEFADKAAELTGADTAETHAIKADLDQLLKEYDSLAAALVTAPSGTSNPDQLSKLFGEARSKAEELAEKRAKAAVDQRCQGSSAVASGPEGGATSSYLPDAVRTSKEGDSEPNDPWTVCSAARQYLQGISQEMAGLVKHGQSFVGQTVDFYLGDPMAMEEFVSPAQPVDPSDVMSSSSGEAYLLDAQFTQQRYWQFQVAAHSQHLTGVPFSDVFGKTTASLQPAKRHAYYDVQKAIKSLWMLSERAASVEMEVAEADITGRQWQRQREFNAEVSRLVAPLDALPSWERDAHAGEVHEAIAKLCTQTSAAERPIIDAAVRRARAIAIDLYKVQRRLIADLKAWQAFGVRDGAGTTVEGGTFNYQDEDFAKVIGGVSVLDGYVLPLSHLWNRGNLSFQYSGGLSFYVPTSYDNPLLDRAECVEFGYFLDNPNTNYPQTSDSPEWDAFNQKVLSAVQQHYPEAVRAGGGSGLWLDFTMESHGQRETGDASGASFGQSP